MRHALLTLAVGALLASTSCAGNPAHQPTPMPGPRVTTAAPSHPPRRGGGAAMQLAIKPHPLLNIEDDLEAQLGQLDRIAAWHSRETADGGMVGDFCNECGDRWPCETRRMADGTHEDLAGSPDGGA